MYKRMFFLLEYRLDLPTNYDFFVNTLKNCATIELTLFKMHHNTAAIRKRNSRT